MAQVGFSFYSKNADVEVLIGLMYTGGQKLSKAGFGSLGVLQDKLKIHFSEFTRSPEQSNRFNFTADFSRISMYLE